MSPPPPSRRVIEPPQNNVRQRPPHAIRSDGVGPYQLGAQLDSVLSKLATGPRIAQYDIPGVVRASVLRADETIAIGGEPRGKVSFIAVTGSDVARTETGGIHVGSSRDELLRAFGPLAEDADHARDPHLLAPTGLPMLRAVFAGDAVIALVLRGDVDLPRRGADATTSDCARPVPRDSDVPSGGSAFGACLVAGEVITVEGDDLSVHGADGERPVSASPPRDGGVARGSAEPTSLPTIHIPNLVFAAALRNGDRDDLVAISRSDDATGRTWSLTAYHADGQKLVRFIEPSPLYQLTESSARWIGAELQQIDLYLELVNRGDTIEVGGLLVTHDRKVRDVVSISPVMCKRGRPVCTEPSDAATAPDRGPRTPLPSQ